MQKIQNSMKQMGKLWKILLHKNQCWQLKVQQNEEAPEQGQTDVAGDQTSCGSGLRLYQVGFSV